MAIIKLASPVSGIRGTVGGIVYSANRAGPYAKTWYRSSNPRTPSQTTQRGRLSQMGLEWAALSDATRADWDTYAADPAQAKTNSLGETYYASGWNWFCAFNTLNLLAEQSLFLGSPTASGAGAPTVLDLIIRPAASGGSLVRFAAGEYPAGTSAMLYMRPLSSIGNLPAPNSLAFINYFRPPSAVYTSIQTELETLFGDPQVGQVYFAEVTKLRAEGRATAPLSARVEVT